MFTAISVQVQIGAANKNFGVSLQDGHTPEERGAAFKEIRAFVDEMEAKASAQ